MTGKEWLAWFATQPQVWCANCYHMNEVNPPSWWRGNCWHASEASASKA